MPLDLNAGRPGHGYRSRFQHRREHAAPGYYHVFIEDPKVTAEMTATTHVGFQRYTFPAS